MDILTFDDSDNSRKILSVSALAFSMLVFCGVILLKLEVWAQNRRTEVQMVSDQLDFEGARYQRTVVDLMKKNNLN